MRATYTGGASAWDKEVKHCNLYLYICISNRFQQISFKTPEVNQAVMLNSKVENARAQLRNIDTHF